MAALLLVTVIVGSPPVTAQGLMRFSVTQVRQLDVGAPVVRAYLDLTDTAGRPLEALPESSLTATLGEWPAEPVNVVPFSAVQQGIAYVFLVDISKSLSSDLFQQMVGGIETWVAGMSELDRAAIIAFGDSSRLIVDFTDSRAELLTGLESLGPTDNETLLHQALADALDLNRRLDVDLPGRRAVVIFSDGKDEGSAFVGGGHPGQASRRRVTRLRHRLQPSARPRRATDLSQPPSAIRFQLRRRFLRHRGDALRRGLRVHPTDHPSGLDHRLSLRRVSGGWRSPPLAGTGHPRRACAIQWWFGTSPTPGEERSDGANRVRAQRGLSCHGRAGGSQRAEARPALRAGTVVGRVGCVGRSPRPLGSPRRTQAPSASGIPACSPHSAAISTHRPPQRTVVSSIRPFRCPYPDSGPSGHQRSSPLWRRPAHLLQRRRSRCD